MRFLPSLCVLLATPGLSLAGDLTTVVDFESGSLQWSGPTGIGGSSGVVPGAGNPGAGLQTVFNNFGVTFSNSQNPAFVGDYSGFDSVTLSVDTLVNQISFFGTPAPRPWLVELRDFDSAQGGFPWTSVWFLFDNISADPDWITYSVTIDDPTSTSLPAGWGGYGAEDPTTFEPILPAGVTFADVLAGVDEIAFTTLQPGFFFGFADFDLVLDNITISTEGGDWDAFGAGLAGSNGVPAVGGYGNVTPGSPSTVLLTGAAPNAPAFLALGATQVAVPIFGGTLLSSAELAVLPGTTNSDGIRLFSFNWPTGLTSGVDIFWQYGILDGSGPQGITLSNGLQSTAP